MERNKNKRNYFVLETSQTIYIKRKMEDALRMQTAILWLLNEPCRIDVHTRETLEDYVLSRKDKRIMAVA